MFLARKQVIIRNIKKVLYVLACAVGLFVFVFLFMLMVAKHNELHQWFYGLLGM